MKNRSLSNTIKYISIFLFCVMIAQLCSCELAIKKAENLSKNIPFNYPGLRLETRYINKSDIKSRTPKIVCFGDSVTFGWNLSYDLSYPYLLENHLSGEYPELITINSGVGGNTIQDGKKRLESDVLSYKPDLVVVNFGLNDAMLNVKTNEISEEKELFYKKDQIYYLPQADITEFERIYKEVIDILMNSGIEVLVLSLNPVLDYFPEEEGEDFSRKQKEIFSVYNRRIIQIAEEEDVAVIDLWDVFSSAGDLENYLQQDGLHPSEEGQYLISIAVKDYLAEMKF
jgi:lysophospholipase L1-like esterase